jgi:hypothetical protein
MVGQARQVPGDQLVDTEIGIGKIGGHKGGKVSVRDCG